MLDLTKKNHASTVNDTQIDYCFSRNPVKSYYYETVYSDHKAVWVVIESKIESSSKKLERTLSRKFSQIQLDEKFEQIPNKNKIGKSLNRGLSKINLNN